MEHREIDNMIVALFSRITPEEKAEVFRFMKEREMGTKEKQPAATDCLRENEKTVSI